MPESPRPSRLREAHAHLHQHGRALTMVDLARCPSAEAMLDALAARAAETPGRPTLAHGARPEAWKPRTGLGDGWPSLDAYELAVGAEYPCVAWCFDYHALLANRAALARAGFADDSPDPPGGLLGRDDAGRLTGVVYEKAALMVWASLPEPTPEERRRELRAGIDALRALGFTEMHDLKAQPWLGAELAAMLGDLGEARFTLWPLVEHLAEVAGGREAWERGDRLRLGGGKIFVDGTLNSRTAWMLEPYADGRPEHPAGLALMDTGAVAEAVRACDALGVPMAAHAIGDGAVRAVLDALEVVRPGARGWRIEHAELIHEDDIPRIVRLSDEIGLIISVQPCHLLPDVEALRRAVPNRLGRVLPLRALIDAGLVPGETLLFGSDVPIVRANPEDSILAATARRRADMADADAIAPEQAIGEAEAWACFRA